MKKQDYNATIIVTKTASEAFKSIKSVNKWWTENIEGNFEKLNDVFTMHSNDTFVTHKIVEFVSDKKIVWQVTDCNLHFVKDKKEWKGTQISFDISTKGNATQISFTHMGLVPEVECYNVCSKGWDEYIKGSLFKLITEGEGLPVRKNN
jgi:hypothetical protein